MEKRNMEDAADGVMLGGRDLGTHRAYEFGSAEQPEVDPRLGQPVWATDWKDAPRRGSITGSAERAEGVKKQAGPTVVLDEAKYIPAAAWEKMPEPKLLDPIQPSWMKKHDFEILFKDSIDYFVVKNARLVLAVNGWVVFHVFKGDAFAHQEMYPTAHIHRMKVLKVR